MILLALTAASLAAQAAGDGRLPYSPIVSVSSVRATAAGQVSCAISINGVGQADDGCGFAAGAPRGLRQLHRDAQLTMIFAIMPTGAEPPGAAAAQGELIVEGRARLDITSDGRIARCETRVDRVIRQVAGVRRPPNFCDIYPVGQSAFDAADGSDSRWVEISALIYLREGPPS